MCALLGGRKKMFQEGLCFMFSRLITLKCLPDVAFNGGFYFGKILLGNICCEALPRCESILLDCFDEGDFGWTEAHAMVEQY